MTLLGFFGGARVYGPVVRALAFHQCDMGSNRGVDAICVWSTVGSPPLPREVFLGVPRFSLLLKNQHFQVPIGPGMVDK